MRPLTQLGVVVGIAILAGFVLTRKHVEQGAGVRAPDASARLHDTHVDVSNASPSSSTLSSEAASADRPATSPSSSPAHGNRARPPGALSTPPQDAAREAQRGAAAKIADAIGLTDPIRGAFITAYLEYVDEVLKVSTASIAADEGRALIGQRTSEFEARVAAWLTPEQLTDMRDLMRRPPRK